MRYFKVLDDSNRSCHGGNTKLVWSLPVQNHDGSWTSGSWMPEVTGVLKLQDNGYHLTDRDHLLNWLDSNIYEVEPSEEMIVSKGKIVCRSVRLLKKMHWDNRIARLFACDCAEHVLPLYEKNHPNDNRPRRAIETARLFAADKVSHAELAAVCAAVWSIGKDTVRAAAWAAKDNTEEFIACDASFAAIGYAAEEATRVAVGSAMKDAAWVKVWEREHRWQIKRLMWYLEDRR